MYIVVVYALVGILWIVGSDWLLYGLVPNLEEVYGISVVKGIAFISVMSVALYFLLSYLGKVEDRARLSEATLDLFKEHAPQLFASIPVVIYVIEINNGKPVVAWVSENAEQILGYPLSAFYKPDWWAEHIHPEDRLKTLSSSQDIFARGGGVHEYRFRLGDGTYALIKDELQEVIGDDESTKKVVGVWHDITNDHAAQVEIQNYANRLEKTLLGTVNTVAKMVELRDPYTAGHEARVGDLAVAIAREMGLDGDFLMGLKIGGLVHDIGKISVPSEFLTKPTRLSEAEYEVIKRHAENGYHILKHVDFPWPIADMAYQHHERMDGSGYPQGLKGEDILLEARILAVADTVESMATARPYRMSMGVDRALAEVESKAGKSYDSQVVKACLKLFREKAYNLPDIQETMIFSELQES